jgi:magnesium-transporting ATPase (P-type)
MGNVKWEEQNYTKQPFLLSVDEVVQHLETSKDQGLSNAQVQQYADKYGPNRLQGDGGVSWYSILGKQISNAMILVCSFQLLHNILANKTHRCWFSQWLYPMVSKISSKVL